MLMLSKISIVMATVSYQRFPSVDGGEDEHDIMIFRLWMQLFVTVWLKLLWLGALLDLARPPTDGDGFLCVCR